MSRLADHIEDYLALRRALGFKLGKEGGFLPDFAAFTDAAGAATVTVELAVRAPERKFCIWDRCGVLVVFVAGVMVVAGPLISARWVFRFRRGASG
jgi:hypothetical protein